MRQIWSPDPRREVKEAIREANRAFLREDDGRGGFPGAIIILATVVMLILAYASK